MKLAIVGSRGITDRTVLDAAIQQWFAESYTVAGSAGHRITEVISGSARGVDTLAAQWATEHGVKLTECIPDWEQHGHRAALLRNEDIVRAADAVLVIWDCKSTGTKHSMDVAKRLKKPTIIIYV